jgi:myo-inositol catabolism protein IolC
MSSETGRRFYILSFGLYREGRLRLPHQAFDPTSAKVLVRYDPDSDAQLDSRQEARLTPREDAVRKHLAGRLDAAAASKRIAHEYRGLIDVYAAARRA